MKPVSKQTDEELIHNLYDAMGAAKCAIELQNPKLYQYLAERDAVLSEQIKRSRIRGARRQIRENGHDKLTVNLNRRRLVVNSNYSLDRLRSGMFQIGWYRRYDLI